ncbi:MAG: hypothetical protein ACI8QS_000280 [Planctomycetota bacterium]|jgi:hypothetical protein
MTVKRWPFIKRARIVSYSIVAAVIAVLVLRYDSVVLPEEGCSPLAEFDTGTRLLLDRWKSADVGDAVLFRNGEDLLLGRVIEKPDFPEANRPAGWAPFDDEHLWIVADAKDCPAVDSRRLGPVGRDAVVAVIAAGLPW